jgi:GNAT superfamily N-acetyltransferase
MTDVRRIDPTESALAEVIAPLINRAYALAQEQLFAEPTPRVSDQSVREIIADGEFLVAEQGGVVVGVVQFRQLSERVGFFGMLAVPPEVASTGIARELLVSLELEAARRGLHSLELDLLQPESPTPHQTRLREWYERRGFVAQWARPFSDIEPSAARFLRQPTDLTRFAKTISRPVS